MGNAPERRAVGRTIMTASVPTPQPPDAGPLRWTAAGCLFVLGLFAPAAIPLLKAAGISGATLVGLSTVLMFGIPELLWMLAVAVLGKAGFEQGKRCLFGLLRRHAPPERVSRSRYRIGLAMFCAPLVLAWLGPYAAEVRPDLFALGFPVLVAGDLLFGLSFFVLGGEFWDKIRALFVHGATARFPAPGTD